MSSSTKKMMKSESISEIIETWLLNSPSHGIRRIGQARTIITRLFWTYIFWVFTIFMGTFIYTAIINYTDNPTKMHLSVRQNRDPADFPTITFCNINPLQDDKFLDDERKSRLPGRNLSAPLNESEYRKRVSKYIDRILALQVNGQPHSFVQMGFQLDDLLISCIFNKRLCHRNLTQLFHPTYGNCYTFDHVTNVQQRETTDIPHDWSVDDHNGDNNYKLRLDLFLHQPKYNSYLENRAAFRLFIHRKHEVPILSQNSVFLGPNKYTKLSFSQRIRSFSRHCRTDLTADMKQIFRHHKVRYTQALCYKLCEQRFIEINCQCVEPTFAVFYQFFNDKTNHQPITNTTLCSIDDLCLVSRIYFDSRKLCGECLPECETIQYSVQSSYANYPNKNSNERVLKRVQNHFRHLNIDPYSNKTHGPPLNTDASLRNNIVAVEITASSYPTEILTESPVYTWVDLISSIGGQTGLWIGISLIGYIELIEIFNILLNRFFTYCLSLYKKK